MRGLQEIIALNERTGDQHYKPSPTELAKARREQADEHKRSRAWEKDARRRVTARAHANGRERAHG